MCSQSRISTLSGTTAFWSRVDHFSRFADCRFCAAAQRRRQRKLGTSNETGAKLADEDVQYLDNGENQQLRERACWTALRDRLPTTEIPGYPEAIQCGTPSAAVTQELPQAVPVSVSAESSRADTEELIEKKPQKKPVRRKTRKSTPVETQTEAQKTAEPVIEETPVETALAPQALPASSIVVTGDLPADVPEMLSAAEKAEDAFEKETAQEVGEEDATRRISMTIVKLRIAVLSQSVRVMYRMLLKARQ